MEYSNIIEFRRHILYTDNIDEKKKRARKIAKELQKLYPDAKCSLEYEGDAWKLLVMSRLSAQCTDERVNIVSKRLFETFPDVYSMRDAEISDIEKLIFTCGLYHTKAKNLKEMCKQLCENFAGQVPDNFDDLMSLSGVGSKIANLMLGDVFGKGGIVADTHCIRITNRLSLVNSKNQSIVERTLSPLLPKKDQSDFCHRLVLFGREICRAKNPTCETCPLRKKKLCDFEYDN